MVEKDDSLDKRLVSYDSWLFAHRSGSGESRMGSPRHTHVCLRSVSQTCVSPDLAPTGSLALMLEHTGLGKDCQLFRVRNFKQSLTPRLREI